MSLYISLVCIFHRDLCHAKRDQSGLPLDSDLQLLEDNMASYLLEMVATELNENIEYFIELTGPKVKKYNDMVKCIESGKQSLEAAEIIAIIKLLKTLIYFYEHCHNHMTLLQSHHPIQLTNVEPLNLLLSDNQGQKSFMPLFSAEYFYSQHNLINIINGKIDLSVLHEINSMSERELDYKELCSHSDQCINEKENRNMLKSSPGNVFGDENIALCDIKFEK